MLTIVCITGIIGICIGALAAACADVFPTYREPLKLGGGGVLLGGVSLLGFALPMI